MPRLIATDGSGVVNGKEKNPVRPVKPRYPVSPVSLYPISRYDIILLSIIFLYSDHNNLLTSPLAVGLCVDNMP